MKKADFILIGVVAVIAAVLLVALYGFNNKSGDLVQIEIDAKVVDVLPLNEDAEREIETTDGGVNTLVIKDGSAKMVDANCPDGICVNHKEINRAGESIICLPHKVVITVVSDKETDNDIDAVA